MLNVSKQSHHKHGQQGLKFAHTTMVHPCFNQAAHSIYARLHLPVASKCNIQCNYCKRAVDKCEQRPGVTSYILSVERAVKKFRETVKKYPQLSVVGVAGPGDALANRETFLLLKEIHREHPHLIKCIATNGLLLSEKVRELVAVGVRTVTVTVNAVNPAVGAKVYEYITYGGAMYTGVQASKILISKQVEGIEAASKNGLAVKINSVLIPEINQTEILEIAKLASELGAFKMNIIPLIPLHKFEGLRPPTCRELRELREQCERYIPQFRLCKMCRSDACGIPGLEKTPMTLEPSCVH